jgi:hypothetical protein
MEAARKELKTAFGEGDTNEEEPIEEGESKEPANEPVQ